MNTTLEFALLSNATSGALHGRNDFVGAADRVTFDSVLPQAVATGARRAKITLKLDERGAGSIAHPD